MFIFYPGQAVLSLDQKELVFSFKGITVAGLMLLEESRRSEVHFIFASFQESLI